MRTKLSFWTGVAALLALAMVAMPAQAQSVVGTPHDLSSNLPAARARVCVFCHTPHQPDGPPIVNTDPLWNHTLSANATYGVYASVTMNATPTEIGGGTTVSNLCLSCHDGTVGIGSLYNNPNDGLGGEDTPTNSAALMTGNALVGTDLTNDHPVNFTYDTTLAGNDGELVDPAGSAAVTALLFGGTVQCASCHDPHDNTNTSFLVTTNVASALCLTCHVK